MTTIGPQDPVSTSDTVTITFGYSAIFPEFFLDEADVRSACEQLGLNVLSVDVDVIIGFRKIIVQFHPATAGEVGVVGKSMADAIRSYFTSVFQCAAEKYELGTASTAMFSTASTISLASIAIIVVVGYVVLKGKVL